MNNIDFEKNNTKTIKLNDEIKIEFVWIPPGIFKMRDGEDENREQTVKITDGFWMGKYPITVEQFLFYLNNGADVSDIEFSYQLTPIEKDDGFYQMRKDIKSRQSICNDVNLKQPMYDVPIETIRKFCKWLSDKYDVDCHLPTEEKWEYACRAELTTEDEFWEDEEEVDEVECTYLPPKRNLQPVGLKEPNNFGLYDMLGNIWEECEAENTLYDKKRFEKRYKFWDEKNGIIERQPEKEEATEKKTFTVFCGGPSETYDNKPPQPYLRGFHCATIDVGFRLILLPPKKINKKETTIILTDKLKEESINYDSDNLLAGSSKIVPIDNDINIELVWIPPGKFTMLNDKYKESESDEYKYNDTWWQAYQGIKTNVFCDVIIEKGFWMSKYVITQKQWLYLMGYNPSREKDLNLPVHGIDWYNCKEFCLKLYEETSLLFEIPTKSEWEYAYYAGLKRPYNFFNNEDLDKASWHLNGSNSWADPVGLKEPNNWGLYDMFGNICINDYDNELNKIKDKSEIKFDDYIILSFYINSINERCLIEQGTSFRLILK